ncbi:hypothetical protein PMAYCL1PPCAC_05151 [Pristionchus mayeri]|uniref:Uncharacterized protein n=1 Tax=Pristionchus mayeri TaxID=1317129 RepID=A0AAN5CBD0_9BILA|nr:hypothetical protein PMAYCL1PPCAC_05151 [Pristionchus mayeri]
MAFASAEMLEVRLINFYYEEEEHEHLVPDILEMAAHKLCYSFPRQLAFDEYFADERFMVGGIQDLDTFGYTFRDLAKMLNDHGIIYEKNTGISNAKAGFVVGYDYTENPLLFSETQPENNCLNQLLLMPLRASAYIDSKF